MRAIQNRLLEKAVGFTGELFADWDLPVGLLAARVSRGRISDGPRIIAPSGGSRQLPQIGKIKEKLCSKRYDTAAPLELFAYSTRDHVDGLVHSMDRIDACVKAHLLGSPFRRVRVFNFGLGQLKYSYPS